jgi:death-on-curing family protein
MKESVKNPTIIFKPKKGKNQFNVIIDNDENTVWVSESQITELFDKSRRTIGYHISNIYKEKELTKKTTWRKYRQVQKEGNREVERDISLYNLDIIISVGYRVKSKIGIEFRKWATQKLKDYLVNGYTINTELLQHQKIKLQKLENEIQLLNNKVIDTEIKLTNGFLSIITSYSKSFELLNQFDTDELSTSNLSNEIIYVINYNEVKKAINELKNNLILKSEASNLFGNEKDKSFEGILGSISQTVYSQLAYPTIEEQSAQLLYSIIKGHSFSDGNKRIGSFIFVWFLEQNNFHLNNLGHLKINNNTLVTLALTVAQSLPKHREIMIKLIINLIKN